MSTVEDRSLILGRIRAKHPDRVPVLIIRKEGSKLPIPGNTK